MTTELQQVKEALTNCHRLCDTKASGELLKQWDHIRSLIQDYPSASLPREVFELLFDEMIEEINAALEILNKYTERLKSEEDKGEVSDGYHTFNELYEHRHALFSAFVKTNQEICWKSMLHDDGTMFDDWFIAWANLPDGVITYHIPLRLWDLFECRELKHAPKWDGHTSNDVIDRLKSIAAISTIIGDKT